MAFELPIVATITEGGVTFRVRALPWGLAREASRGADEEALAAKVYDRCVEAVDGDDRPAGISIDDLPASLVARLVRASSGAGEGNPPSPPRSTAPVSGG